MQSYMLRIFCRKWTTISQKRIYNFTGTQQSWSTTEQYLFREGWLVKMFSNVLFLQYRNEISQTHQFWFQFCQHILKVPAMLRSRIFQGHDKKTFKKSVMIKRTLKKSITLWMQAKSFHCSKWAQVHWTGIKCQTDLLILFLGSASAHAASTTKKTMIFILFNCGMTFSTFRLRVWKK